MGGSGVFAFIKLISATNGRYDSMCKQHRLPLLVEPCVCVLVIFQQKFPLPYPPGIQPAVRNLFGIIITECVFKQTGVSQTNFKQWILQVAGCLCEILISDTKLLSYQKTSLKIRFLERGKLKDTIHISSPPLYVSRPILGPIFNRQEGHYSGGRAVGA